MRMRLLYILFFCLWPCLLSAADWNQVGEAGVPVQLEADQLSYDRENGVYRASGDVRLQQGNLEVRSQSLQWNQISGEIDAEGNVKFISPNEELSGSKATYNLQQGTGTVDNGYFFLRDQNLYVRGEKIER
ncbi:MAG: hypothetical protein OQK97_09840, partial [Deltaproteobacteria bacterium]|nr:hypothetical protein [Deltaproteobacteria bacterium]